MVTSMAKGEIFDKYGNRSGFILHGKMYYANGEYWAHLKKRRDGIAVLFRGESIGVLDARCNIISSKREYLGTAKFAPGFRYWGAVAALLVIILGLAGVFAWELLDKPVADAAIQTVSISASGEADKNELRLYVFAGDAAFANSASVAPGCGSVDSLGFVLQSAAGFDVPYTLEFKKSAALAALHNFNTELTRDDEVIASKAQDLADLSLAGGKISAASAQSFFLNWYWTAHETVSVPDSDYARYYVTVRVIT